MVVAARTELTPLLSELKIISASLGRLVTFRISSTLVYKGNLSSCTDARERHLGKTVAGPRGVRVGARMN